MLGAPRQQGKRLATAGRTFAIVDQRRLEKELVNRRSLPSWLELQSAVLDYLEASYKRQRRHSNLGGTVAAAYQQLRLLPLGG